MLNCYQEISNFLLPARVQHEYNGALTAILYPDRLFKMFSLICPLLVFVLFIDSLEGRIEGGQNDYGGNARRVNVADTEMMQIYQKWVDTGLSSLIAAVADKRLVSDRLSSKVLLALT